MLRRIRVSCINNAATQLQKKKKKIRVEPERLSSVSIVDFYMWVKGIQWIPLFRPFY